MELVEDFFDAWDALETMFPFGVQTFGPLFADFGVPITLCNEVDDLLFLDLIPQRSENVRRIKVEGRHSRRSFWVYVEMLRASRALLMSFQNSPNSPLRFTVCIVASPYAVVDALASFHQRLISSGVCWRRRPIQHVRIRVA